MNFEQAAEAVSGWSQLVLECRAYGHAWRPHDVKNDRRARRYLVSQVCDRCTTVRHQEMDYRGQLDPGKSWYDYPPGYLTHGQGRMTGEARGALRIAALGLKPSTRRRQLAVVR
jgi:hypothetical protein